MVDMIFSYGHEKYSIYTGHEKTAMVDTKNIFPHPSLSVYWTHFFTYTLDTPRITLPLFLFLLE